MVRLTKYTLNGSSPAQDLDAACGAMNALRGAIAAVKELWPNRRDFCHAGGDADFEAMVEEHTERLKKLNDILKEVEEMANHAADAAEFRE